MILKKRKTKKVIMTVTNTTLKPVILIKAKLKKKARLAKFKKIKKGYILSQALVL